MVKNGILINPDFIKSVIEGVNRVSFHNMLTTKYQLLKNKKNILYTVFQIKKTHSYYWL